MKRSLKRPGLLTAYSRIQFGGIDGMKTAFEAGGIVASGRLWPESNRDSEPKITKNQKIGLLNPVIRRRDDVLPN
jgi:hypothetical protein